MVGIVVLVHRVGHLALRRAVDVVEEPEHQDLDLSFAHTSVWSRVAVLLAGPAANFFLAVLLFWGLLIFEGGSVFPHISTTVGHVAAGSPAAHGGIRAGDRIVAVNGEPIRSWEELARQVPSRAGQVIRLTVERAGSGFDVILVTKAPTLRGVGEGVGRVAVIGITRVEGFHDDRLHPLFAFVEAAKTAAETVVMVPMTLGKILSGTASLHAIGGPPFVSEMVGGQIQLESWAQIIYLIGHFSIILGVLSVLPLPFVDGGRLCFLVIEKVRGKPVSLATQRTAQWVVVFLLAALVILAAYRAHDDEIFRFLKTL